MSGWDGYVNDMMKDTGYFDNAVIFGADSSGVWAQTSEFTITDEEMKALLKLASTGLPQAELKTKLFTVNGHEYEPILVEKGRIYAEKTSNRNAGLLALVSKQCAAVGTYPAGVAPGMAVDTIEKLIVYLAEQGL